MVAGRFRRSYRPSKILIYTLTSPRRNFRCARLTCRAYPRECASKVHDVQRGHVAAEERQVALFNLSRLVDKVFLVAKQRRDGPDQIGELRSRVGLAPDIEIVAPIISAGITSLRRFSSRGEALEASRAISSISAHEIREAQHIVVRQEQDDAGLGRRPSPECFSSRGSHYSQSGPLVSVGNKNRYFRFLPLKPGQRASS